MIPRHPFERIPPARLGPLTLVAGALVALTTPLVLWAVGGDLAAVVGFTSAGNAAEATRRVAGLSDEVRIGIGFLVGFDYLYDILHDNAVALACVWASRRFHAGRIQRLGGLLAWVMWLDIGLNWVENPIFFEMVQGRATDPWVAVAGATEAFRTTTLAIGVAYAATGLVFGRNDRGRGPESGGDGPPVS